MRETKVGRRLIPLNGSDLFYAIVVVLTLLTMTDAQQRGF